VASGLRVGGGGAFVGYAARFFLPIRGLGAKYTVMQAATVAAERIFGLLDTEPVVRAPAAGARDAVPGAPAVEFRNVWFAYQDEGWVIRDCSFTVAPVMQVEL